MLLRVNANEYRHYTLSGFDEAHETCEVIFTWTGKGPTSSGCKYPKGDRLKLIVDRAKVKYNEASNQHFFFGDETSLGLYESLGKR